MSNVWVIKDDNFFTNKEYEELMTSYTRNQSFDPAVPTSAVFDEYIHEIIEGKDDYLTTDDNYSDFDNSALNERYIFISHKIGNACNIFPNKVYP